MKIQSHLVTTLLILLILIFFKNIGSNIKANLMKILRKEKELSS